MTRRLTPSLALAAGAGAVIIALTATAFWLSYAHLAEVALAHGLKGKEVRAWAWPATLDLFIVAGELLMLRAALQARTDWWAIGLTVAGSGGSIALNVAGVGSSADTLDYVVAAVPPTAALLAFGALMRQVHQALVEAAPTVSFETVEPSAELTELPAELVPVGAEPAEPITLERAEPMSPIGDAPADAVPVLGPFTPLAELAGGTGGTEGGTGFDLRLPEGYSSAETPWRNRPEPTPELAPEPVPPVVPPTGTEAELGAADIVSEDTSNTTFEARVALVRTWLLTEPDLTGTEIGTRLGKSDGYGRRVLRTARDTS